MMNKTRRKHSATFKTKVVLDMLKETQTLAQLSGKYGVHASQLTKWKREFLEKASGIFSDSSRGNGHRKGDCTPLPQLAFHPNASAM